MYFRGLACEELSTFLQSLLFPLFRARPRVARAWPRVRCLWSFNLCFPERQVRLLPHFIGESPSPGGDPACGHTTRKGQRWDTEPGGRGPLGTTASVLQHLQDTRGTVAPHTPGRTPPLHGAGGVRAWGSPCPSNTTGGRNLFCSSSMFINSENNNTLS